MDVSFAERSGRSEGKTPLHRSPTENPAKPATLRVLWIDDEPDLVRIVVRFLLGEGCAVDLVDTGAKGLALARTGAYDIVLLDLVMPGMSGLQVLEALRREGIRTSVVVVTGRGTPESGFEAAQLGAVKLLTKPLRGSELLHQLRQARREYLPAGRDEGEVLGVFEGPAHLRVAKSILIMVDSAADIKTLSDWAQLVGSAQSTLENWCDAAGVNPKEALRFARLLRASVRFERTGEPLSEVLDVADPRTLSHLRDLAGLKSDPQAAGVTVAAFFDHQQVLADSQTLRAVRNLLAGRFLNLA